MAATHLIRVGAMGYVGPFASVDAVRYPRGAQVIVRTVRGLEIGTVLAPLDEPGVGEEAQGSILRGITVEDQLLQARLEKNRDEAYTACAALLTERGLNATLLDVEQLFDGSSLIFYFLGEVDAEINALTDELAEAYEAKVQLRQFSETLTAGCGPGCGTPEAEGGACGSSCSTCAVVGACGTKKRAG